MLNLQPLVQLLHYLAKDVGTRICPDFVEHPECKIEHYNYLKDNAPFIIDQRYDLDYNLACNITKEDYERTFISLLSESLVDDDTLFFSEKIWKPIMVGHPFILYGNKDSLKYLKSMGYKTFDGWIDESYDDEPDRNVRSIMVVNELKKFENKTLEFEARE